VRFQTLISRLNSGGAERRLSAVAADSGYYDQPHLIREFKDFTGVTPGKYYEAVDFPRYYSKIVYV
jgi:AraC-like DNA-binding protein